MRTRCGILLTLLIKPEVSQGRLEALMNFQTAVCDLTAMPLANCSLLDEATAAAEAVTMMYALRPRDKQKAGANVVFVDENIFPQTLAVMTTRAIPQGIELRMGKYAEFTPAPEVFALYSFNIPMPTEVLRIIGYSRRKHMKPVAK